MSIVQTLNSIRSTSGTNAKMSILERLEGDDKRYIKKILKYAMDPFQMFWVQKVPEVVSRKPIFQQEAWDNFFDCLDASSARKVTGNAAIAMYHKCFSSMTADQEDWCRAILKKHLSIGISDKTVNKVFPGLISSFEVSLAHPFEEKRMNKDLVYVEPKLDGVRCLAFVENGDVRLFSRQGKELDNFQSTIGLELSELHEGVYDGEIMGDSFQSLMKQTRRKTDVDVSSSYFAIFDFMTHDEYKSQETLKLSLRKENLQKILSDDHKYLKIVPWKIVYKPNLSKIEAIHKEYVSMGYEGTMIKSNSPYNFKRSYDVMKLKDFKDADLPVIGFKEGTGRHQGRLGSILVDFKGVEVDVGSGFSDEMRDEVWSNRDDYLGKIAEISYQEVTDDGSLRFPTFICFRGDK